MHLDSRDRKRDNQRDRLVPVAALVAFGLWLASIGPVRSWAGRTDHGHAWVIGVAPSFFAACTFAWWQAFAVRTGPLAVALYAVALVAGAEAVQVFLPGYMADLWDVVAGVVGAAAALPLLLWRERRRRPGQDDSSRTMPARR